MSDALWTQYLALPEFERALLELAVVVHEPLSRRDFAEWVRRAALASTIGGDVGASQVEKKVERLASLGLLTKGSNHFREQEYRVASGLQHPLLAHLKASRRLEPYVAFVRKYGPLADRFAYRVPWDRVGRELVFAGYVGTSSDVFAILRKSCGRHGEPSAAQIVAEALGPFAPRHAIEALPVELLDAYVGEQLTLAGERLETPSVALLEVAEAHRPRLSPKTRAMLARLEALRGNARRAESFIAGEESSEALAAASFVALTQDDFARARLLARHAIESTRSKKTKKVHGIEGALAHWLVLALLTERTPESTAYAEAQLASKARDEDDATAACLDELATYLAAGKPDLARMHEAAADALSWEDLLVSALCLAFCGAALSAEVRRELELAATSHAFGASSWAQRTLSGMARGDRAGLLALYAPEEPWERTLRALEKAVAVEGQEDVQPEPRSERLVWIVVPTADGPQLSARLQVRSGERFSMGRQLTWKKLYEAPADTPWLTEQDRKVVARIESKRDTRYGATTYTLDATCVTDLVGHPLVFADEDAREPVEVVRGTARLDVREQDGAIHLAISPSQLMQRSVWCERDGLHRLAVYVLTPAQQSIADQLTKKGLALPEAARERLKQTLGRLVSHFAIASEVGVEGEHIEDVEADSRLRVQLRRVSGGLSVRVTVLPLGAAPAFAPGHGSASVIGTLTSEGRLRTVRTMRDLSLELERERALFEACPRLAETMAGQREARVEGIEGCLELVSELRRAPEHTSVEWPEGEPLRLLGERDVRDLRLTLASKDTWLAADGELEIDGELKLAFRELLLRTGSAQGRFVELDDGRFLALTSELKKLLDGLSAISVEKAEEVRLHRLALGSLAHLADELRHFSLAPAVEAQLARVREAEALDVRVPPAFEAELRPYQVEGYAWLTRLSHIGAGACLADDMGLGKTLQTLALLVAQAPEGPSLVVAPTSVCGNWLEEARRFAPGLRMLRFGATDRGELIDELGAFDVLVCSYGVLQQEIDALAKKRFRVVVLDEAQAIKNAATHRARAAMRLVAEMRVALTGTPVENHIGELWSIMSFLNPGYLGSVKQFEERFQKPIQRGDDVHAAQRLKRLVRPFVLRRKKNDVLDDLPEKTVVTLHVEPSAEERALFAALREHALAKVASGGKPGEARMRLLAELTRLRRAACHPDLVAPEAKLESSKLATFEALLDELRSGGHRVLVFSQFVDYLSLVRARLDAQGIPYQYLDGSSSPAERARSVSAFQAGQGDAFLISLKAGGFGLNLTAADYVVHLDPWWNPAVEDQASDRAHRIGQTRPVTVYRLVMQGTVEEKILALHAHKRDLADQLLDGTGKGASLSVEELTALLEEAADVQRGARPRRPVDASA